MITEEVMEKWLNFNNYENSAKSWNSEERVLLTSDTIELWVARVHCESIFLQKIS